MKTERYRPREEKMRGKYFKRSYKSHKKDMERKPTELRPKRTHSGRPCEQNTKKAAFGYGNPIVFTKFAREGILEQMTNDPTKNQQTGRRRIVPGIDCLENYFAIFDTIVDTTPETLNGLMFATCQAGSCCFSVDLKQHTLRPNDTLLMLPGQTIRPGGHSEDFKGRFMFISSEFMADVTFRRRQNAFAFFIVRDNPLLHLSQDDMQMFVQYHDFIRKRMREAPDASRVEIVRHLLGALFYEFLAIDNPDWRRRGDCAALPAAVSPVEYMQKSPQAVACGDFCGGESKGRHHLWSKSGPRRESVPRCRPHL